MKSWITLILIWGVALSSCDLDEPISSSQVVLQFSTDTLQFDTLLSDRISKTFRLRVKNPNSKGVLVDIRLGKSPSSYQLSVNGSPGAEFSQILIPGEDSLLVLVTSEIEDQDNDFPYPVNDSIIFEWNNQVTDIKLRSWGEDVVSFSQQVICDEIWTDGKPYVVTDTLLVDFNCELRIEAGTRVYFNPGAALFIQGTLTVLGDESDPAIFRNSRRDANYKIAPGQWDAIYFLEGSTGNRIEYATIENGRVGLRIGTPDNDTIADVIIHQVIIRHMSESGIQAFSSDVMAQNLVIYNTAQHALFNVIGGNYSYNHCTFTNIPSQYFSEDPIVQASDFLPINETEALVEPLYFTLKNSVVWGQSTDGILIAETLEGNNIHITDNLIRSSEDSEDNMVELDIDFPGFSNPNDFDYQLDSLSILIDMGQPGLTIDVLGNPRDSMPDIGAFEYIVDEN